MITHVITESGPFGGAQRNTLLTVQGLQRDGYQVELICGPGGRLITEARAAGVPVRVMPDLVRPIAPIKDLRAGLALYRLFRSHRPRVVHTHSTKAGLLGRVAAWWARVPVIVHTVHGYPFVMGRNPKTRAYVAAERLLAAVSHRVVCVGEILRGEVADWGMAPRSKLTTIYSGIDFAAYVPRHPPPEVKQSLGIGNAWPVVGTIGHLVDAKAQHHLVDAIAHLLPKFPSIKLLVVGEGPRRPVLEARARARGVSSHIVLLGERDDVADLLNVFDVFAMSSEREGVGRALSEAMYFGLPIVATSVNGVCELVRDGHTGLLVPPHDPPALATGITRIVSNPELARRLGANAQCECRRLMDADRMVTALERLYQDLTATAPSEAGHARHREPIRS